MQKVEGKKLIKSFVRTIKKVEQKMLTSALKILLKKFIFQTKKKKNVISKVVYIERMLMKYLKAWNA